MSHPSIGSESRNKEATLPGGLEKTLEASSKLIAEDQTIVKQPIDFATIDCFGKAIPLDELTELAKKFYGGPSDPIDDLNRAFANLLKRGYLVPQAEINAADFLYRRGEFGRTLDDYLAWRAAAYAPGAKVSEADRIAILRAFIQASTKADFEAIYQAVSTLPVHPLPNDLQTVSRVCYDAKIDNLTEDDLKQVRQYAGAVVVGHDRHKDLPQLPLVVGRCAQLKHFASTHGADASYEHWRGCLSIIKFCAPWAEGDAIEALCSGHTGYSRDECEGKMADCSAPFRCETIGSNEHCNGCKYRGAISSPIGLGFSREPNVARRKGVAA